jgi:hypothetical protein
MKFKIIEGDEGLELHNEDGYLCHFGETAEDVYELQKACETYMHG